MTKQDLPQSDWEANNKQNTIRLAWWTAAWVITMANRRHLKGLDEMQQKIQLEAMALSLGVGLIGGLAYSNLDVTNLIAFDAEISHLVILMALTYMAGIASGVRRHR